jgi:spermidine synthase
MMESLGRHILVEYYECAAEILNDVITIEKSMVEAAEKAGATIINSTFHHFSPFGVSGVVVIEESHLAIHTWPEYRYAAVDLFTCGDSVDPWISYNFLKEAFRAGNGSSMEMLRGQLGLLKKIDFDLSQARDEADQRRRAPRQTRDIWFTERNQNIASSFRHTGDPLFRKRSDFQMVEIYDTYEYGKMLTCDGKTMCAETDESAYHEMIVHVPMCTHPNPQRVLVIGGGDGGVVREVVKHQNVKQVVMVEIDKVVIEACKKHLPGISSALGHPKLDLQIADGIKYAAEAADQSFDVIIIDSTDPVGPAEGLFSAEFYKQVYRILKPNGIMITQSESPRFNVKVFKEIYQCYRDIFQPDHVHCYLAYIPIYPSGMWSFSFCSKNGIHPLRDLDKEKARDFSRLNNLSYYNEEVHTAAFALPRFVQQLLA